MSNKAHSWGSATYLDFEHLVTLNEERTRYTTLCGLSIPVDDAITHGKSKRCRECAYRLEQAIQNNMVSQIYLIYVSDNIAVTDNFTKGDMP